MGGAPEVFELSSTRGLRARLSALGASVLSLEVPDPGGRVADVVLGLERPEDYRAPHPHLGATVGRYANRIAGGRFVLDGVEYALERNDGAHHLHGGTRGFSHVVWEAVAEGNAVRFRYRSPEGEAGYPGALDVTTRYALDEAALRIDWKAVPDRPTVVNLTHHGYFDLGGRGGAGCVLDHELRLAADRYTPVDSDGIPTGEIAPVAGTPLDFTEPAAIGARIDALRDGRGGYDHNFELRGGGDRLRPAARLRDPGSGRALEVLTTQPGLQLYTGNNLDGSIAGRGGVPLGRHSAVCLETQHFPDSPNRPRFPSTRVTPERPYRHAVVYRFAL